MALKTTVLGDGKLLDLDRDSRRLYDFFQNQFDYTTETEVREWVALTEAAAKSKFDNPDTPPTGYTYIYRVQVDNKIIGSYTLTRTKIRKTLKLVE